MLLHEYETVIILRPDLDDRVATQHVENLETFLKEEQGTLLDLDDWGTRKLAYPIKKYSKGHYVLFNYVNVADTITEVERRIRLNDDIIRFMTVRLAESVDVQTRLKESGEMRAKREAAAREAAERAALEEQRRKEYESHDADDSQPGEE